MYYYKIIDHSQDGIVNEGEGELSVIKDELPVEILDFLTLIDTSSPTNEFRGVLGNLEVEISKKRK